MDYNTVNNKLKELKIEEGIWIIYIGIIFLSFYSNHLERNYFLYHEYNSKKKYQDIMIVIFTILLFIYLYFFYSARGEVKNINPLDDERKTI